MNDYKDYYSSNSRGSLEDLITGYSKNTRKKGDINSSSLDDSYLINKSILSAPSLDPEYERLRKLALEEDNFTVILSRAKPIAQKAHEAGRFGKFQAVLSQVHETYVTVQKQLALAYAEAGDFDSAEFHLKNAHVEVSGAVNLAGRITDEEASAIIDLAIRKTSPQYFFQRIVSSSKAGDISGTEKYMSLAFRVLETIGSIAIPANEKLKLYGNLNQKSFQNFYRLQRRFGELHRNAYLNAIASQASEALGYAVKQSHLANLDKSEIEKRRIKVKDLMLEGIRKFVPDEHMYDAFGAFMNYFRNFLDPFFDELIYCSENRNHPFRMFIEPKMGGNLDFTIIGAKRKESAANSLVPSSFYSRQYERTGIPTFIDEFFMPLLEAYNRT